jgi:hypothetical protein
MSYYHHDINDASADDYDNGSAYHDNYGPAHDYYDRRSDNHHDDGPGDNDDDRICFLVRVADGVRSDGVL